MTRRAGHILADVVLTLALHRAFATRSMTRTVNVLTCRVLAMADPASGVTHREKQCTQDQSSTRRTFPQTPRSKKLEDD